MLVLISKRQSGSSKGSATQPKRMPVRVKHQASSPGWGIVCLDYKGRSQLNDLLYRRGELYFYAFDLLWLDSWASLRDCLQGRSPLMTGTKGRTYALGQSNLFNDPQSQRFSFRGCI